MKTSHLQIDVFQQIWITNGWRKTKWVNCSASPVASTKQCKRHGEI